MTLPAKNAGRTRLHRSMNHDSGISAEIEKYLQDPKSQKYCQEVVSHGLRSLPALRDFLREDLPIEPAERLEALLKAILREAMANPVSGRDAREIAQFQKELGFILKYKSYTIKAATPVGYSIFLQNEREGFSFQQHVEHKLEVFHILSIKPGGYVFLCDYRDWKKAYDPRSFADWQAGEPNEAYDRFKFVPAPGDVFVISELGVVHTVIGCVLEEYATVSTDMVDRLHDQNAGKKIPPDFNRTNAEAALREVPSPPQHRMVRGFGDRQIERIDPVAVQGGECTLLCDSFVRAARYTIQPGKQTTLERDDERAVLLRISSGQGSVIMADSSEVGGALPSIAYNRGDLILIPPGIHYSVRNESQDYVRYSEHRIAPDVAFI